MELNLHAFHAYAFSNLLDNVVRGALGEYIVATALGVNNRPASSWETWDITYNGINIEVKTSAYLQSWKQSKPSKPSFGIPEKRGWNSLTNTWDNEARRHANVYVFALFTDDDVQLASHNVLDTDYWEFYVVPTILLPNHRSIGLTSLRRIAPPIKFISLSEKINEIGTRL